MYLLTKLENHISIMLGTLAVINVDVFGLSALHHSLFQIIFWYELRQERRLEVVGKYNSQ